MDHDHQQCTNSDSQKDIRLSRELLDSAVAVLESTESYRREEGSGGDARLVGVVSSIMSVELRLNELLDHIQAK